MVCRMGSTISPSCFSSNFTEEWSTSATIFKSLKMDENALVRMVFFVILSTSLNLDKTVAREI